MKLLALVEGIKLGSSGRSNDLSGRPLERTAAKQALLLSDTIDSQTAIPWRAAGRAGFPLEGILSTGYDWVTWWDDVRSDARGLKKG
jgi:hypothetical protein